MTVILNRGLLVMWRYVYFFPHTPGKSRYVTGSRQRFSRLSLYEQPLKAKLLPLCIFSPVAVIFLCFDVVLVVILAVVLLSIIFVQLSLESLLRYLVYFGFIVKFCIWMQW